jgi:predicted RNA binding protein YcfA (HicA-like mRNA interferase family)
MFDSESSHPELKPKLASVKRQSEWIKVTQKLGFIVEPGKGSHYVARNNKFPKSDCRSLIVTIQKEIRRDVSESIFKELMRKGVPEDDIWRALGFLD